MTFHQLRHALHIELDLWQTKWESETVKAKQLDTPTKALSFVDKDYFPNIYVILAISATLPVTSVSVKSISVLKFTAKNRRKSYFDSTNDLFFHICIQTIIGLVQI